jgi:tight adherence protein C
VPRITSGQPVGPTILATGATWLGGHLLCNMWLKRKGRRRATKIMHGLPDALDLMIVCLEAGLGLNATIARVGEERSSMDDPLGREFSQVTAELREGRSREDALRTLGERNGVDELKSLAGLMIQSDKLGASMGKTLRSHADLVRTKRRQRAEEIARKLPVKMLIPLALFILPPLLVVAAGPALLGLQELSKILGTG